MLIDIRAREIALLRDSAKSMEKWLAELMDNAARNDKILLTLHKLALLLIKKPRNWRTQAGALLKRDFAVLHCELVLLDDGNAALARVAQKLPRDGKVSDQALPGAPTVNKARSYFYLPVKKNRAVVALLIFADRKAFPPDAGRDLVRRVVDMLAAAL